jgi:cellulose synthase/poly-beta-1,6-N-acetylglucosamine synthase-like glycosyltransferase
MTTRSISLIFTAFNEAAGLPTLLASISAQTVKPTEVVVCDAGSQDDTVKQLKDWGKTSGIPTVVIVEKGANISRGRNVAIAKAKGPIIAVTDGGCELSATWLADISSPLVRGNADLVYGLTKPVGTSWVGQSYAALYDASTRAAEMNETELSSRTVAFTKDAWQKVGGYPEDLTLAGEDTLFFLDLHKHYKPVFVPSAVVAWRHGAETLRRVYKVHKRNSIGSGEARMFLGQYAALGGLYAALLLGILAGFFNGWFAVVSLVLLVGLWSRRTIAALQSGKKLWLVVTTPIVMAARDAGMLVGVIVGLRSRRG